ncbi:DMT family transporter [Paenibacillus sp. GYB004]|uniref:EamA family transporter n=1 Tax=Paenibacillus sp. GYB004 TaxID=2994393 RepID=UPI002F963BD9
MEHFMSAAFANKRSFGLAAILLGSAFFGIGGTVLEWLHTNRHFDLGGLVPLRLIPSGLLLLLYLRLRGHDLWAIWKDRYSRSGIVAYGIGGILGMQFSFMQTVENGSAVTATLFQFLGPALIAVYIAWKSRRAPFLTEWSSFLIALAGIVLVLTNGVFGETVFSKAGVLWGVCTAFAFAFYTVYPVRLLDRWGALLCSGWGMLIGGVFYSGVSMLLPGAAWFPSGRFDAVSLVLIAFVIVFGTACAFTLCAASLKVLSPTVAGILSGMEPLAAVATTVLWLMKPFGMWQTAGAIFIVASTVLLSAKPTEGLPRQTRNNPSPSNSTVRTGL